MGSFDYRTALELAVRATEQAAALLLAECARPDGPRGARGKCPADLEVETLIRALLRGAFPGWGYLGEETGRVVGSDVERHVWVVDPNDGTGAMQQGRRGSSVAIGLLRDRQPVLGVVRAVNAPDDEGDLFAWAEGCGLPRRNGQPLEQRPLAAQLGPEEIVLLPPAAERHPRGYLRAVAPARYASVPSLAYRLALVAAGEAAATVSIGYPQAWDYAAGQALLRAVGGVLLDEDGSEVSYAPDGVSQVGACFGGSPSVAEALIRADWDGTWHSGFGPAAPPAGFEPARPRPGRLVHDNALLRRAQGCLLGQLAGDALGSLIEFEGPRQIAQRYPDGPRQLETGGNWNTLAGQPTDDSELALLLARSLLIGPGFDAERTAAAYARWCQGWEPDGRPSEAAWRRPFDIGRTTHQALSAVGPDEVQFGRAAARARAAASQSSQANGALMRVSPLGIWGARRPPDDVAAAAREDARLTHAHPVCQDASALYAVAISLAVRDGLAPADLHAAVVAWGRQAALQPTVLETVALAATAPPADYLSQQGWVLIALQNAFFQLLHAPTLEAGVVATVRQGGDTDTNAAICGALLGAVQGRLALPEQWRRMVLTCRPMPGLSGVQHPRPAELWPTDALALAERLLEP